MKSKKAQMNVGAIVILIMGIVACMALLGAIFDNQAVMTTKYNAVNEAVSVATSQHGLVEGINKSGINYTLTNAPTGWKIDDCPLTAVTITNNSGFPLVVNTDYVLFADVGKFTLKNSTNTYASFVANNNTLVGYTWCPDGYNKDTGSRSIAGIIGLFAVLALLAFVLWAGKVGDWFN